MEYRAKDIQDIFRISRSRYDYIAGRIGIQPEIKEVTGTGRAHLYSFKNVVQFGCANMGVVLGLNPRIIKDMLKWLEAYQGSRKPGSSDYPNFFVTDGYGMFFAPGPQYNVDRSGFEKYLEQLSGYIVISPKSITESIINYSQHSR